MKILINFLRSSIKIYSFQNFLFSSSSSSFSFSIYLLFLISPILLLPTLLHLPLIYQASSLPFTTFLSFSPLSPLSNSTLTLSYLPNTPSSPSPSLASSLLISFPGGCEGAQVVLITPYLHKVRLRQTRPVRQTKISPGIFLKVLRKARKELKL